MHKFLLVLNNDPSMHRYNVIIERFFASLLCTIFILLNTAMFIKFFMIQVQHLF